MNVCMVSYSLHPDSRVYRYLQSLNKRGDRVDVVCLGKIGEPYHESYSGGDIYRIQTREFNEQSPISHLMGLIKFLILSTVTCTRLYLKYRYELIHFHNVPDFGVFCTLIPKLIGAKVFLDIHDIVPEFYIRKFSVGEDHYIIKRLKWIEKVSCAFADHVITVTDLWRDRLIDRRSVSPEKCSVVLNVPYTGLFEPIKEISDTKNGKFLLSYHGNLTEPTGTDIAVRAVGIVKEKIADIELQITGKGREYQRLRRLTRELGLDDYVRFVNRVSIDEIPGILARADVGIDPKRGGVYAGETLSVKAMEYLSMRIPLIISRTKTAQLYFDDSMVSFFEPDDAEDLARCIVELYEAPEKRNAMIKGAERFNQRYFWGLFEKAYFDLVDRLCIDS